MAELDARRSEVLGNSAKIIQRKVRSYIARKEFLALRNASIHLQALWRGISCSCICRSAGSKCSYIFGYCCCLLELFLFAMLNLAKLLHKFFSYLFSLFSEQQRLLLNMCCL
jgi:hypothetical protein